MAARLKSSEIVAHLTAIASRPTTAESDAQVLTRIAAQLLPKTRTTIVDDVDAPAHLMTPARLVSVWNELRSAAQPSVAVLSRERRTAATARIAEVRAKVGPDREREFWRSMVTLISNSPGHNGKNDRRWVADFDYLLRGRTWVRFIEHTGWFKAHATPDSFRSGNDARRATAESAAADVAARKPFVPGAEAR